MEALDAHPTLIAGPGIKYLTFHTFLFYFFSLCCPKTTGTFLPGPYMPRSIHYLGFAWLPPLAAPYLPCPAALIVSPPLLLPGE
jgi:hypothetical protein